MCSIGKKQNTRMNKFVAFLAGAAFAFIMIAQVGPNPDRPGCRGRANPPPLPESPPEQVQVTPTVLFAQVP
jgi:hypothetical protein